MQTYTIDIRPRRQATIPRAVLQQLGVDVGDQFVASVQNATVVLKPKKQVFLDAFKALQKAFQESGIPESEFQEAIQRDRKQYARKNYPRLYRH